jgi:ABC-type glutathione transport system ATPase component
MRAGAIVETAPTAQLFANPQHDYTRMLINAHPKGSPSPIAPDAPEILNATVRVDFPVKSGILQRTTRTVTAAINPIPSHAGPAPAGKPEQASAALVRLVTALARTAARDAFSAAAAQGGGPPIRSEKVSDDAQ